MTDQVHIVLDDTAMTAVGRGNVIVSRLINRAHTQTGWYLYAPACALVEADRARPGTAEHLASLPGLAIVDLDLPAVLALSRDETWAAAHCQYAALPSPDLPDGAFIATAEPKRWVGHPVRVLDVTP